MAANSVQVPEQEADERMFNSPNTCVQRNPIFQAPILRLPTEMLAMLFVHCACDYYYNEYGDRIECAPSWVNVSYVCRRWRDVALNCPTLWTYHFVVSLRWTEELLARSKQALLNIRMIVVYERFRWADMLERLMNHGERIQEFLLAYPDGLSYPELLPRLSFRARHLRNLRILLPCTENVAEILDHGDLPPLLLDGDNLIPGLRKLVLIGCRVPWHSLTSGALTTLRLICIPHRFRKDPIEFLTMLGSMQGLEQLQLDCALHVDTHGIVSTRVPASALPKIDLPHLTCLSVAASFPTLMTLLSCINIPSKTELRLFLGIEPTLDSFNLENFNFLSSHLAHRFEASRNFISPPPTIRSLIVQNYTTPLQEYVLVFSSLERDDNCDRLMTEVWNTRDDEWGCNIPLKISITIPTSMGWSDRDRIISNICRSLPLENVQSVHTIKLDISSGLWGELFGRFPGLRHIKLIEGSMPGISSILSEPPLDHTETRGGDQKYMSAPALEELELYRMYFVPQPTDISEHVPSPQHPDPDLPSLLDVLSKRKTRCKLTMTECFIGDPDGDSSDIMNVVGWWEDDEFKVEYTEAELTSSSGFSEDDSWEEEEELLLTDDEYY